MSPEDLEPYRDRDSILKYMGFDSYQAYLLSDLWCSIRSGVLEKHPRCHRCGRPATAVHHKSYAPIVLYGKRPSELIAVCRGCHWFAEFIPGNPPVKGTLWRANKILSRKKRKRTKGRCGRRYLKR